MNLKTLKRILQIRKNEEYMEVQKYSKEQAIVEKETQILSNFVRSRSLAFSDIGLGSGSDNPSAYRLADVSNSFIQLRERQISFQSKRLENARVSAEKAFQALRERIQQRKIVERLIEKEKSRLKKEREKKQQKSQDEFSQQIRRME